MTSPETTPENSELNQAVEYLNGLEPGHLPYDLFLAISRLAVRGTVEMVPLRKTEEGSTEVLLTQRPEGDLWAGQWHVPGSVMLPTDQVEGSHDYSDAFGRIFDQEGELENGVQLVNQPVYVDSERRKTIRGDEVAAVHYAEVNGEPTVGAYFDMTDFPHNVPAPGVISHHVDFIKHAVKQFETDHKR
ncbi:MAG: hypothetical protein ABIR37_03470 [Candidatus Saccharimonadales bacterium]